ncbi:hypothetical protein [Dyella mobilis]|uniref:Uncharacterized protein n=1 Tax=Dyella mobilis TaxID=1849582 RepID=A0ABS2KL76_9GAMM|nr:hypothetical protein [Dyella mobilis]MBM7131653.1 hypothetical protein [Dyella mobilis]
MRRRHTASGARRRDQCPAVDEAAGAFAVPLLAGGVMALCEAAGALVAGAVAAGAGAGVEG